MKADTETTESPATPSTTRNGSGSGRKPGTSKAGRKSVKARSSVTRASVKRGTKTMVDDAADYGKSAWGNLPKWAEGASQRMSRTVHDMHMPDTTPLQDYVRERPLILGAVGLGLGALIGAMIPRQMVRTSSTTRRR